MLENEDYVKTIAGEGVEATEEQRKLAQTLFELHEKDVQGLKVNSAALKEEKEKARNELKLLQEKYDEEVGKLTEELKAAKEQISSNSPEEVKKYYETQLATVDTSYKSQLAERDKKLAERDSEIEAYKRKEFLHDQKAEFEKAIRKTNADPTTYDTIELMVLGERGDRFDQHDTADGKMFWTTDGSGKSIANVIDEVLNSPVGKRFCNSNSSGSGAVGGAVGNTGAKIISKSEFDRLTPAEKVEKAKSGWTISE